MPHIKEHEERIIAYAMAAPGEEIPGIVQLASQLASCAACLSHARQAMEDLPFIAMAMGEGEIRSDLQICDRIETRLRRLLKQAEQQAQTKNNLFKPHEPASHILRPLTAAPSALPTNEPGSPWIRRALLSFAAIALSAVLLFGLLKISSSKRTDQTQKPAEPHEQALDFGH